MAVDRGPVQRGVALRAPRQRVDPLRLLPAVQRLRDVFSFLFSLSLFRAGANKLRKNMTNIIYSFSLMREITSVVQRARVQQSVGSAVRGILASMKLL